MGRECQHSSCLKQPSYGVKGSRRRQFCVLHAEREMVDLTGKRCASPGCSKHSSYGVPGGKRVFCAKHAEEDMVDLTGKRCASLGCSKHACYGIQGDKRAFCTQHAKGDMVGVTGKRCASPVCSKSASYGLQGGKRVSCAQHAKEKMVDLTGKRCASSSCSTYASYGLPEGGKRIFCSHHAEEDMVDLTAKRCASLGCSKHACYGIQGGKRAFCTQHAKEEMEDLTGKRCVHRKGFTTPSFGARNSDMLTTGATQTEQGGVSSADSGSKRCSHQHCSDRADPRDQDSHGREPRAPQARPGTGDPYIVESSVQGWLDPAPPRTGEEGKRAFCAVRHADVVGNLVGLGQLSNELRGGTEQTVSDEGGRSSWPGIAAHAPASEEKVPKRTRTAQYRGQRFRAVETEPGLVVSPAVAPPFYSEEIPVFAQGIAESTISTGVLVIKPEG